MAPGGPIDESKFAVITDMPVNSLVTFPADGFRAAAPRLEVRGFAWSGHVPLASVAVSADGGASWQAAELDPEVERFAWRAFRVQLDVGNGGELAIASRATDARGRSQPLDSAPWNPRGYCNNAVHWVRGRSSG
jgi:hypothetical protein